MEKYFDAFLYLANWGTHELMLRMPRRVLPLETAKRYCAGDCASARAKGDHVVLSFRSEEEGGEWVDEDNDTLAALVPVRAELASGDLRALYIAWLGCVQNGEVDDDDSEPPCPPGLGKLSAALEAFANFLWIDPDLIDAAAATSPDLTAINDEALRRWVSALPEEEKTALLVRLTGGAEAHVRAELLLRFRESLRVPKAPVAKARTVGEILEAGAARAEERMRREAERADRENARREREAAAARERHLTELSRHEAEAWRQVEALIATKQPKKYDEAIDLLCDLRDLCIRGGRQAEAETRITRLREEHANKRSLIERIRKAGLAT